MLTRFSSPTKIVIMRADLSMIEIGAGIDPQWSPDGMRVAYWANTPGGLDDIFTMNIDGSDVRNMTNSAADYEERPIWSPDGSMIAFDALVARYGVGVMRSDGSDRRFLTVSQRYNYISWYADGSAIVFQKPVGKSRQIYRINADGSGETALTTDTTGRFYGACVSPNRRYVSYSRYDSLYPVAMIIKELDSGREKELAGGLIGGIWSPQSDWVYSTELLGTGNIIVRINPQTMMKQDLSQKPFGRAYNDGHSSLTRDGKWLAFYSNRSGVNLIYLMASDGSRQQQITTDPQLANPLWKP